MAHVVAELEMIGTQLGLSVDATWGSFDEATAARTANNLSPVVAMHVLTSLRDSRSSRLVATAVAVALVLLGAALLFVGGGASSPVTALAEPPPPLPLEPEIPEEDQRLARIDDGEAEAVLAALNKADRLSPADELIRGHALFALGNTRDAWRAYDAAVGAREVDDRLLERALAALQERRADAAMDVLASWPNDEASKALKRRLGARGEAARQPLPQRPAQEGARCGQGAHGHRRTGRRHGEPGAGSVD